MPVEKLFGTDGIRGAANQHPMTAELTLKVARAAAHMFQRDAERRHTILIGKDTRRSGYMFENALTAGFCSMGMNVLLTGPLPTPGVSYIMRSLRCDGAVMISASHNPFEDNGIKFFGPDGFKLEDDREHEIERLVSTGEVDNLRPMGNGIGRARRIDDAVGRYIEFAKASFPKGMRLDGLKMVVDGANGACYKSGPFCFRELGAEVISIGRDPDGSNINLNCGSMYPEKLQARVIKERADLGVGFDGDGDRIVMVDETGRLLDGNALLAVLALDRLDQGNLPQNTLVTTIMANGGLERALTTRGGKLVRTRVGDRYVVEAMRAGGYAVGGESSGHVIILEHNTTGDALITGLQILATMLRSKKPLSTLAAAYQPMPEAHESVPFNPGAKPNDATLQTIRDEAETLLAGKGRTVIRASGTEPIIRVMVQHEDMDTARRLTHEFANKVRAL